PLQAARPARGEHAARRPPGRRGAAAGARSAQGQRGWRHRSRLFGDIPSKPDAPRAITAVKEEQVQAARAGTPAKTDWQQFVWPASDARWARLFGDASQKRLEELAEDKLLPFTFDPARRKGILSRRFPN